MPTPTRSPHVPFPASVWLTLTLVAFATACDGTVTATPNPVAFGDQLVGGTTARAVTLNSTRIVSFGPGLMDGDDKGSFLPGDPGPRGTWRGSTRMNWGFSFTPTRTGDFTATYTTVMITGTMDVITLTGRAHNQISVGMLAHADPLLDGLDFLDVCVPGPPKDLTFTVINVSNADQELRADFSPAVAAFTFVNPVPTTIGKNGGTSVFTIRYTPSNPPAVETSSMLVRYRTDHEQRTGVVLKGRGKLC